MAASGYPTLQYLAGKFVISAGSVLFRQPKELPPTSGSVTRLQVCILHQLTKDEWLLPKGRKDQGETIEAAAVRETYEETGYRCSLWAQRMPTRAPSPNLPGSIASPHPDRVWVVDNLQEPIAMTIRDLGNGKSKMILWFITVVGEDVVKVEGSQMENENFESVFMDWEAAVETLTYENDRDIVRQAVDIVLGGYDVKAQKTV